jgi:hypothetical protein
MLLSVDSSKANIAGAVYFASLTIASRREPNHRLATAMVYALLSLAGLLRLRIINRIHY